MCEGLRPEKDVRWAIEALEYAAERDAGYGRVMHEEEFVQRAEQYRMAISVLQWVLRETDDFPADHRMY